MTSFPLNWVLWMIGHFSYDVLVPKYLCTGSILLEMFDNVAGFGESHFVWMKFADQPHAVNCKIQRFIVMISWWPRAIVHHAYFSESLCNQWHDRDLRAVLNKKLNMMAHDMLFVLYVIPWLNYTLNKERRQSAVTQADHRYYVWNCLEYPFSIKNTDPSSRHRLKFHRVNF